MNEGGRCPKKGKNWSASRKGGKKEGTRTGRRLKLLEKKKYLSDGHWRRKFERLRAKRQKKRKPARGRQKKSFVRNREFQRKRVSRGKGRRRIVKRRRETRSPPCESEKRWRAAATEAEDFYSVPGRGGGRGKAVRGRKVFPFLREGLICRKEEPRRKRGGMAEKRGVRSLLSGCGKALPLRGGKP